MPRIAMMKFSARYGIMLLCGKFPPVGSKFPGDMGAFEGVVTYPLSGFRPPGSWAFKFDAGLWLAAIVVSPFRK
jgi:hypothetical protein